MVDFDAQQAFSRNLGLITPEEQEKLSRACIALPGLGGVGGAYAEVLARQGIGKFRLADFDVFEQGNFNRQFGATMSTLGKSKLEVTQARILDINPEAKIQGFPEGIGPENIDAFLDGVDVLIDSIDFFQIDMRILFYRKAYEKGIPVVNAAPVGFGATLQVVMPGQMSFEEFFDLHEEQSDEEKLLRFAAGLAPMGLHVPYFDRRYISFHEKRVPSSSIGVSMCAGVAGTEVLRLVLGWPGLAPLPYVHQFDLRRGIWRRRHFPHGSRSFLQKLKRKFFTKSFEQMIQNEKKLP